MPDLDAVDFRSQAALVGIKDEYVAELFEFWMKNDIRNAWNDRLDPPLDEDPEAAKADANLSRALRATIRHLEVRGRLGDKTLANFLDHFLDTEVAKPKRGPRKRSRPERFDAVPANHKRYRDHRFRLFFTQQLRIVIRLGGSVSPQRAKEFIEQMRALLPAGFIPAVISPSVVARCCTAARKATSRTPLPST
jgi:hypothetical protein